MILIFSQINKQTQYNDINNIIIIYTLYFFIFYIGLNEEIEGKGTSSYQLLLRNLTEFHTIYTFHSASK